MRIPTIIPVKGEGFMNQGSELGVLKIDYGGAGSSARAARGRDHMSSSLNSSKGII